jgi:hypothetical protein
LAATKKDSPQRHRDGRENNSLEQNLDRISNNGTLRAQMMMSISREDEDVD